MMILAARNGEWPPAKPKWLAAGAALKLETMPSARLKSPVSRTPATR